MTGIPVSIISTEATQGGAEQERYIDSKQCKTEEDGEEKTDGTIANTSPR